MQVAELHAAALAEDASVFDYDSHYDTIQAERDQPKQAEKLQRQSRYITGLLGACGGRAETPCTPLCRHLPCLPACLPACLPPEPARTVGKAEERKAHLPRASHTTASLSLDACLPARPPCREG